MKGCYLSNFFRYTMLPLKPYVAPLFSGNLKQILIPRPFSADSITTKKEQTFIAEVETFISFCYNKQWSSNHSINTTEQQTSGQWRMVEKYEAVRPGWLCCSHSLLIKSIYLQRPRCKKWIKPNKILFRRKETWFIGVKFLETPRRLTYVLLVCERFEAKKLNFLHQLARSIPIAKIHTGAFEIFIYERH